MKTFYQNCSIFERKKILSNCSSRKKSDSVQTSLKSDNLLEPCYMAIYYEIDSLETLGKISIFTEICRGKKSGKNVHIYIGGQRGWVS